MAKRTRNTVIAHFSDRIRFNWGFHDATRDQLAGCPRILLHGGKQNPQTVSKEYDAAYFHGYARGLKSAKESGMRLETSEPAWNEAVTEGLVS